VSESLNIWMGYGREGSAYDTATNKLGESRSMVGVNRPEKAKIINYISTVSLLPIYANFFNTLRKFAEGPDVLSNDPQTMVQRGKSFAVLIGVAENALADELFQRLLL